MTPALLNRSVGCTALLAVLMLLTRAVPAQVTDTEADALLQRIRPSIVKVKVIGTVNGVQKIESGTGFLIQTQAGPRVMTAAHVIGRDSYWDDPGKRLIYLRWSAYGSSIEPDPVVEAQFETHADIAQVYIDPINVAPLDFGILPQANDRLFVPTWGRTERRSNIQRAKRLSDTSSRLALTGNYEPSHSGLPVLNGDGKIVGILVERSLQPGGTTQGLALRLPYQQDMGDFARFITNPVAKVVVPKRHQTDFATLVGTCVFVGKRSALTRPNPLDMPFGADILRRANNSVTRAGLIGQPVRVVTGVNLRSKCPIVIEKGAYYGRRLVPLIPGDQVVLGSVTGFEYLDDVFYWAEVVRIDKRK